MNVYGEPSCTYPAFVAHLRAHSPAADEATAIWNLLIGKKVDPAVALGFFHHESSCGTMGRARTTKSWGNIRYRNVFADLPFIVRDEDGFVAYQTYADGARHFAMHLRGEDFTNAYGGRTTVEQVVAMWAPTADGNAPLAYITAVNEFARSLGGIPMTKPRVLFVAGHVNIELISTAGLAPVIASALTVARLKASTGSRGEREWTGDFVVRATDALNATGLVEAAYTDAVYHPDVFGQHWDVVEICHFHRDADTERAMFATVDDALVPGVVSQAARDEGQRLVERLVGGYTAATGIPVTEALVTLNMTQIYTYDYVPSDAAAVVLEFGNANLDGAVLYEPGIAKIVRFIRDATLEHLNLAVTVDVPQRRVSDGKPPLLAPINRTPALIAGDMRKLADELEQVA